MIQNRIFFILTVVFTMHLAARPLPTDISQVDKPPTLKVLLVDGAESVYVEAKGRYHLYNLSNDLLIDSGLFGKKGEMYALEGGIKWGEHLQQIDAIRIVPGDSQSTILINGIEYKGCIDFRALGKNLRIINEIDVESFLSATLFPKFSEKLSDEVAEAISIVARTNAYYFLKKKADSFWHVTAKNAGYLGYALSFHKPFLDRALERTKEVIMTYQGASFPAFWNENSAGITTTFSAVFRKEALVPPGVKSPLAAHDREKHRWAFTLTKERLAQLLHAEKIQGIDLFCDQSSGKVYGLRVKDGSNDKNIPFIKLQQAIGEKKLQSNDFIIHSKADSVVFEGYGKGLGMGLCLYSAARMAERGDKAPKILKTFFPGACITRASLVSK